MGKNKEWQKIHNAHYDWWMFPNDRNTANQVKKYSFTQDLLHKLMQDKEYIKDYLEGVRIVMLSWGWDLYNSKFVKNSDLNQRWTNYPVRLLKIIYSLILTEQYREYLSIKNFTKKIISKYNISLSSGNDWKWIYKYCGYI